MAGKPTAPDGTANPIHEFHDLLQHLDKWTIAWARANKILGDEVDDNAYDRCYVPLCRVPGEGTLIPVSARLVCCASTTNPHFRWQLP